MLHFIACEKGHNVSAKLLKLNRLLYVNAGDDNMLMYLYCMFYLKNNITLKIKNY